MTKRTAWIWYGANGVVALLFAETLASLVTGFVQVFSAPTQRKAQVLDTLHRTLANDALVGVAIGVLIFGIREVIQRRMRKACPPRGV